MNSRCKWCTSSSLKLCEHCLALTEGQILRQQVESPKAAKTTLDDNKGHGFRVNWSYFQDRRNWATHLVHVKRTEISLNWAHYWKLKQRATHRGLALTRSACLDPGVVTKAVEMQLLHCPRWRLYWWVCQLTEALHSLRILLPLQVVMLSSLPSSWEYYVCS